MTHDCDRRWSCLRSGCAGREIRPYAVWRGQARAYKPSHTEWLRLRAAAEKNRSRNFCVKAFHDMLRMWPMPLTMLGRMVLARA